MNARCIKYRDTYAAPGSELFAALDAGNKAKAESIYQACEARLRLEQGIRWEFNWAVKRDITRPHHMRGI